MKTVRLRYLVVVSLFALFILGACTISPVVPQSIFDVTATARAVSPEPTAPAATPAVVPPTVEVAPTVAATDAPTAEVITPTVELPTVTPAPTDTPQCVIKGNINQKGEKIYYLPGQVDYARTVIDVSKGEAFFCTEADAVKAGFRKALK